MLRFSLLGRYDSASRQRSAGAIFITVLPQFVEPVDSIVRLLALPLVYEVLVVGWLHCVGLTIAQVGQLVGASALRRKLSAVTGIVLIGLGARLVLERR